MIPSRLVSAVTALSIASVSMASGNSNLDCSRTQRSPNPPSIICINSTPGITTVGALDRSGQPQPYSSRGPGQCSLLAPFISAPTYGRLPWGAGFIDTHDQGGGTSSTAPMVAGAMAILLQKFPEATNWDVMAALASGAVRTVRTHHPLIPPPYDFATGFGLLQVQEALGMMGKPRWLQYRSYIRETLGTSPTRGPIARRVKPSVS